MKVKYLLALSLCWAVINAEEVDDDKWIVTVEELGTNATMDCLNGRFPNGSYPTAWMFPNLTIVDSNYSDGHAIVHDNGYNMTIVSVSIEDLGLYHCMMLTDDYLIFMNRMGLNVKGPYFEDLWEKYETNTIIGVSSFFGFLILAGMTIGAWTKRWETRVQPNSLGDTGMGRAEENEYNNTNYGFQSDNIHMVENAAKPGPAEEQRHNIMDDSTKL